MKKGQFSVITPIYKDAYKTFGTFYNALKNQDYDNFEIVVVLDGPNKSARSFLKKYSDIRILEKEWGGAPSARNYGADNSDGEYLTFLDPDVYLNIGTLSHWANAFEENPEVDFVYGDYALMGGGVLQSRPFGYLKRAIKYTNFISGAFPLRRKAYYGWDPDCKSLQDWDMRLTVIEHGHEGLYFPRVDFYTDPPQEGGISMDSHNNWIERTNYVRNKHGNPKSDICVTSVGAKEHALNIAENIGADFLENPMFKPNEYKMVYLIGLYPEDYTGHLSLFSDNSNGTPKKGIKKVIHWVGGDVAKLMTNVSYKTIQELRGFLEKNKFILLSEVDYIQKELLSRGVDIKTGVVPIPPRVMHEIAPLPKKFVVANYINPTQDVYNEGLMTLVAKAMPDIEFKFFGGDEKKVDDNIEYVGWVDMKQFVPKCSALTRFTDHDGLPIGPVEFMQAGRNVVTNVNIPHTIQCSPDRESIVKAIREAQAASQNIIGSEYWREEMDPEKFKNKIRNLL